MISEADALAKILEAIDPLEIESLELADACGRFAAGDLFAALPLPMFDNSSMDGYAVEAKKCTPGAKLKIGGEQPAGLNRGLMLRGGEAIRIFTGAPIPGGADAVIMQEDVRVEGDSILPQASIEPGENIRRRGIDLCEGQKILSRGERITPQRAGLLATQGLSRIEVGRAARVAILSTGDELIAPGEPRVSGAIYESNGVLISALVAQCGAASVMLGIARDESDVLREKIKAGLQHDALIISGGVSVGERDLVKAELGNLGAQLDLWRVAIKPGKPFLFGRSGRCKIFGLPGNPVSAFVTFLCFVRPAILKMMGANELSLPERAVATTVELSNRGDRPHYIRGRIAGGKFTLIGRQESHALFGLSQSNALVRVAPNETWNAGASVTALVWD